MSIASSRSLKTVLVPLLLAAALLTQGLRLCLHEPHAQDTTPTHVTAVHFESNPTLPADTDDDANNRHVELGFAFVKQLTDNLAFAVLLAVAWMLFLPRTNRRFAVSRDASPVPSADRRLRPPLRAPPR